MKHFLGEILRHRRRLLEQGYSRHHCPICGKRKPAAAEYCFGCQAEMDFFYFCDGCNSIFLSGDLASGEDGLYCPDCWDKKQKQEKRDEKLHVIGTHGTEITKEEGEEP